MKVSAVGVAETAGGTVMVSVTGTLTALPPVGVMSMLPLYGPAGKALELTLTTKVDGVVLLPLGLTDSQLPVTCVVKVTPEAPEALVTLMDWAAGLDPAGDVKLSEVGDTVTFPVLPGVVTLSVTPTV